MANGWRRRRRTPTAASGRVDLSWWFYARRGRAARARVGCVGAGDDLRRARPRDAAAARLAAGRRTARHAVPRAAALAASGSRSCWRAPRQRARPAGGSCVVLAVDVSASVAARVSTPPPGCCPPSAARWDRTTSSERSRSPARRASPRRPHRRRPTAQALAAAAEESPGSIATRAISRRRSAWPRRSVPTARPAGAAALQRRPGDARQRARRSDARPTRRCRSFPSALDATELPRGGHPARPRSGDRRRSRAGPARSGGGEPRPARRSRQRW